MADSKNPLVVISGIPYGRSREERFDLYAKDWSRSERPVVVLIPGNWRQLRARKPYIEIAKALVDDGAIVAVTDYPLLTKPWPEQRVGLARALPIIARESQVLGGRAQRLILCGDGFGGFLATQLVLDLCLQKADYSTAVEAWIVCDSIWSEENLSAFQSNHAMRKLFHSISVWQENCPLNRVCPGLPPCLLVQTSSVFLGGAEQFAHAAISMGNEIFLAPRPEQGSKLWRGIGSRNHQLRVMWRPWLARFIERI